MKKKIMLVCMALAMSCAAFAQNHWTVKGGVDFTHPVAPSPFEFKTGVGAQLGASYSIALLKNFYFEPGLNIGYHTWSYDLFAEDRVGDMLCDKVDNNFRHWEMSMPLYADYVIDLNTIGLHVFTGPQFNYGLSNKFKAKMMIGGNDMGYTSDMYDGGDDGAQFKRFGMAWNVGAGVKFATNLSLDFTASLGLTDMGKNYSYEIRKNNFSLTLGYSF